MKNKKELSVRIWVSFSVLALVAFSIIVKTFVIQFDSDLSASQDHLPAMQAQLRSIEPTRGNILSSEGRLLAASVPMYEIRWDAKTPRDMGLIMSKLDSLCEGMSAIFGQPKEVYARRFQAAISDGNRYARIEKDVTFNQLERFKQLPIAKMSRYKSGLIVDKHSERQKPFGKLASRTVGIFRDNNPVGIEEAYHDILAGVSGQQWQERIAGNTWKPVTEEFEVEPVEGLDVVATIDVNIQDAVTHALEDKLQEQQAAWGCMIVMEVETGYIRAISNLERTEEGNYVEKYNFAIAHRVEPGSTFKLPVMIAAMEDGIIQGSDSIETGNGIKDFYGHETKDSNYDKGGHGTGTAAQVFAWSSNVGLATIVDEGYKDSKQAFLDRLKRIGVADPLHVELKGENPPEVYANVGDGAWSGISHVQMAIGYECKQTPLQTLALYNAIANDGVRVKPQFAQAYARNNEVVQILKPQVIQEQVCTPSTLQQAQRMLEMVCEPEGTAYAAFKSAPYKVAGKTGTAKMYNYDTRTYYKSRYRASFAGYFPADDPTYSAIVVIHDPRNGSYYGSSVAAPVFREVADRIYTTREELLRPTETILAEAASLPVSLDGKRQALEAAYAAMGMPTNVGTDATWVNTSTKETHVELTGRSTPEGRVPNVQGMGLRDALYLLENEGIEVVVSGYGRVRSQSLAPGTHVGTNTRISLELGS